MSEPGAPVKMRVYRESSGRLKVAPSPVVLQSAERFTILNVAEDAADVTFPQGTVTPATLRIPTKGPSQVLTAAQGPMYFEYDVVVDGDLAEGNSKPGAIIDP